ncbi:MAG: cytoplasmic filament protein CfpA [bacterium]|nr:cytoplasmic filament protein CfpA [bacterium]
MARETFTRGPNYVHPEKPSAVGSRNSLNRTDRNEYEEAKQVIDEEVDKIINHIHAKLPPEVLERLDVMGSIKSKLHNYFNQDFQNMLNRYIVTMEDEMAKKFRDLVDKEENRALAGYTPRGITDILERIGAADNLNTGEIERSIVNMYGHLQGHIERGVRDLEAHTNSLLREKSDVGAFVRGDNSYAIVKCSFRDNHKRPKAVMDLKLSISILDSELISPIYHYQVPVTSLVKDVVAKNIHSLIDKEIDELANERMEAGQTLGDQDKVFEKFKVLDKYVSDEDEEIRYQFVAKRFLDAVEGIGAEIDAQDYDALGIRENIKKIIDNQNLRNRGFNTAVNAITGILDNSRMGYQFIENYKNARECVIREYEDEDEYRLPDERYSIRLAYYDQEQLSSLRGAYLKQVEELDREVKHLWDVCEGIYKSDRSNKGYDDWETLSKKMLQGVPTAAAADKKKKKKGEPEVAEEVEVAPEKEAAWNEISFIAPEVTHVDEKNPTLEHKLQEVANRFPLMAEKMTKVFHDQNDEVRVVVEKRLAFLKSQFEEFSNLINPFHIQPGLLLDIDITSIKKKQTTMKNMSNVINEFLYSVSKGFTDEVFLGFNAQEDITRSEMAS